MTAKRQIKQKTPSWAVYGKHAKFIGLVHDQPDADAAIKAAIVEYDVAPNERGQLMAIRRD